MNAATTNITVNLPVSIDTSATDYVGPKATTTYWSAALYIEGRRVADIGCNGEGRFKTESSAVKAVIREARDAGYNLTVHRGKAAD